MSQLQAQLAEKSGVEVDESLHKDLEHIMEQMTGYVREDLTQDLLKIPGVKCFLSENLCQDPLEGFVGKQRMRGCYSENHDVSEFLKVTTSLRVQGTLLTGPKGGNCTHESTRSL